MWDFEDDDSGFSGLAGLPKRKKAAEGQQWAPPQQAIPQAQTAAAVLAELKKNVAQANFPYEDKARKFKLDKLLTKAGNRDVKLSVSQLQTAAEKLQVSRDAAISALTWTLESYMNAYGGQALAPTTWLNANSVPFVPDAGAAILYANLQKATEGIAEWSHGGLKQLDIALANV